jgi:hypothetical protein
MRWLLCLLCVASFVVHPEQARACSVCATADPTLTVSGSELPYRGRLHLSADARIGDVRVGTPGIDEIVLTDRRFELGATYGPVPDVLVSVLVPGLARHFVTARGNAFDRTSLGDVELALNGVLWRRADGRGRRRLGLFGGLKLPTAPIEADEAGVPLASALQPGCSSVVSVGGVYYAAGRGLFSVYASGLVFLPIPVRDGPHAGDSLRTTTSVQLQPTPRFASRLGVSTRLETPGELAPDRADPNSGGFVGYVTSELVMSPATDVVITLGGSFPVVQALNGSHHEGAVASATAGFDF